MAAKLKLTSGKTLLLLAGKALVIGLSPAFVPWWVWGPLFLLAFFQSGSRETRLPGAALSLVTVMFFGFGMASGSIHSLMFIVSPLACFILFGIQELFFTERTRSYFQLLLLLGLSGFILWFGGVAHDLLVTYLSAAAALSFLLFMEFHRLLFVGSRMLHACAAGLASLLITEILWILSFLSLGIFSNVALAFIGLASLACAFVFRAASFRPAMAYRTALFFVVLVFLVIFLSPWGL